jgi:hypothetical protein
MRGSHLQHPLERRPPLLQQPLHARDSTDDDIDILRRRRDRLLLLHLCQRERDRRQLRRRKLQPPGGDLIKLFSTVIYVIRHQCRKTAVLSCHRFLINSGVEEMNII